jgi:RND family efflux transporter MFP subunit
MLVKKDQRLATFYAPEFLAAASGYLAAVQGVKGAVAKDGARFTPEFPGTLAKEGPRSIQGYKDRLRNFGMSLAQIQQIAEKREVPDVIDIVAPVDGVILARNISEGQHVAHHTEFYRMADLSRVWVIAEIDEQVARYIHAGDAARITFGDGKQLTARVSESLQQSDNGGRTIKLRLEAENPGLMLRPDMLVDAALPVRMPSALTIPREALVDSGAHARVYVQSGDSGIEPREVETGWRFGGRVEVLKGLHPGDRVVTAAAFLVDSESRLKTSRP